MRVGDLTCNVASGWGFVFGSSKDLHCTYRGSNGHREHYTGAISKFGVDVGYTEGGVLVWGVFAPTSDMRKGALSGDYVGASAQATVAVGAGANVLVGGFNKSIDLQPLSVEGSQGPERRGRHRLDLAARSGINTSASILRKLRRYAPELFALLHGDSRHHLGMDGADVFVDAGLFELEPEGVVLVERGRTE